MNVEDTLDAVAVLQILEAREEARAALIAVNARQRDEDDEDGSLEAEQGRLMDVMREADDALTRYVVEVTGWTHPGGLPDSWIWDRPACRVGRWLLSLWHDEADREPHVIAIAVESIVRVA